jgi:hypothetical protein
LGQVKFNNEEFELIFYYSVANLTCICPPDGCPIYSTSFERVPIEWGNDQNYLTTLSAGNFFGTFSKRTEDVFVVFGYLPLHADVTIQFDLILIGNWDGSKDRLKIIQSFPFYESDNAQTIFSETFSTVDEQDSTFLNSDYYVEPTTGPIVDDNPTVQYRLEINFEHWRSEMKISFVSSLISSQDASWGIDNFKVCINLYSFFNFDNR